MPWPDFVPLNVTCPECKARAETDVVRLPLQPVYGVREPVYQPWALCAACGHEWTLDAAAHVAAPAV